MSFAETTGGPVAAGRALHDAAVLLQTGALQRAIFDSANFSCIATDAKGVIQLFNVGAERMLGYSSTEVVNKITPADISDPHEVIARSKALTSELNTPIASGFDALAFKASRGIEDIYELTYIRKDGSRFPAVVSVTALRDADKAIIGYLLIGTDNTARKRAEEALLEAGALQSAIFNSANFSSIATDARGVIQIFNVGAERMLGYSAAEVMNRITPADISDPQELVARAEALSVELATLITPGFDALVFKASRGIEDIYELTYIRKDGSRFPAVVSVTALRDADKAIIGYLLIGTDNTARKRAEEALLKVTEDALRRSLARFGRLSDSGIVGIITADVRGSVVEANDAYLKMLGYSRQDFIADGLSWSAMTPPEFREADDRAIELMKIDGVAPPWEKELIRKDGSRVPVLISVAMLDHPECIALVADISARKNSEKALVQSQEQFRQAQKMDAIGRLAGGIAHDFNNLLSVILIYTELGIQGLEPTEPLRAELAEVMKAAERAAALTKQLLAFGRQQIFELKVIDLNELMARIGKMLARVIGEDIELALRPGGELGSVRADPGQIEQVLMNLAVNARDAMPSGGKLTIETANTVLNEEYARTHLGVQAGAHVMLAVSDTGVGMDKALQARIFEPFFTTKEVGKGTGLGLSTVFGIVQQSKGHIWIYSELGKGTTFKVYLPRTDEAVTRLESGLDEISSPRGTETILLVEDEEQIRTVILTFLRRFGYQVLEAQNAGEGLLIAEKHPGKIDLLLTDVVMPHMSGVELVRRVASIRPDMKVLCMSGYADEAILNHGFLDAGLAFLQKPITSGKLAHKIRAVLAADKWVAPRTADE